MYKLPIVEHFLSVWKSQAETQVAFQAKTQAKIFLLNWAPGLLWSWGRISCNLRPPFSQSLYLSIMIEQSFNVVKD